MEGGDVDVVAVASLAGNVMVLTDGLLHNFPWTSDVSRTFPWKMMVKTSQAVHLKLNPPKWLLAEVDGDIDDDESSRQRYETDVELRRHYFDDC